MVPSFITSYKSSHKHFQINSSPILVASFQPSTHLVTSTLNDKVEHPNPKFPTLGLLNNQWKHTHTRAHMSTFEHKKEKDNEKNVLNV
jgi:hypothetical protein